MCNSDRILAYLDVEAMIDHENDDRGSDWLKQHFGRHPELWLFSLRFKV